MRTVKNCIEVQDVCLSFGRHTILDAVSFAIPQGCYVGIVGPNGGGKTTLIKILLGLLKPDRGVLSIFNETPLNARRRGRIGYVPQRISQESFLFPVSVEEMVWSGRTPVIGIGKRASRQDREAVETAMSLAHVEHMKNRLVGSLSGGERQKVFIARSLAAKPSLLILDEPTTGVDLAAKEEFYGMLKNLNTELGITILFVSHDIEVMTNEVSYVLGLNQRLVCHCASHAFLSEETMERLYGKTMKHHLPHLQP